MGILQMGDSFTDNTGSPNELDNVTEEAKETEVVSKTTKEENEIPEESSTSKQTPEEIESSNEDETSQKTIEQEISSVEPVKEKLPLDINALRAEEDRLTRQISKLRTERRELRDNPPKTSDVFVPKSASLSDDLSDVAEADVKLVEKIATKLGFVRQADVQQLSYKEQAESIKDAWLEKHSEYKPENDPDDIRWSALKAELDLYKTPSNPRDIVKILDKAHREISSNTGFPLKNKASIEAAKEKLSSSSKGSVGGGTNIVVSKPKLNIDTTHLQGFSDEELKELFS